MKIDFAKFAGSIPYASELYGIYQPLLGWKSRIVHDRIAAGILEFRRAYVEKLAPRIRPKYALAGERDAVEFRVERGEPNWAGLPGLIAYQDTVVGRRVSELIRQNGPGDPATWKKYTRAETLDDILHASRDEIRQQYQATFDNRPDLLLRNRGSLATQRVLGGMLARESMVAGALQQLNENASPEDLMRILEVSASKFSVDPLVDLVDLIDPDRVGLNRAVLSPIGVVHLFRQYFFEFDSFLGPPVQHVWLSPGGTVELVEVSTRKVVIERVVEQAFEMQQKSEKSSTSEDELSDAVRSENSSDTKLGVSADQSFSYGTAFVNGSTSVGVTFDIDQQQKTAREQTHRALRQQTEKLSSEIRKSYKSTFRTVSESTDLNSRRYLLQNTTNKLVNYELRRKMRQVGVQVQDYGTSLCWQTYVDDPGAELGVAKLVHIAQPSDVEPVKDPVLQPPPEPEIAAAAQSLTAEWIWEDSQHGFVPFLGQLQVVPPKSGYIFSRAQISRVSGESWDYQVRPRNADDTMADTPFVPAVDSIDTGDGATERSVKTVMVGVQTAPDGLRTDAHPTNTVQVTLYFKPSRKLLHDIDAANQKALADADAEKARKFQESLFTSARDRVKAASNIQPRRMEDLRDEERIVVYRSLIRQLMTATGVPIVDARAHHVFSELVQSIFDVDRMLYFVAPEWWVPRFAAPHASPQDLGLAPDTLPTFDEKTVVSWGGAKANRPDNYYITEDSTPAKLGSSLGWLLQLDGDNMRNAFLNAPWVKAVIPIRANRETQALEWLSAPNIEGSDGLDAIYDASAAERQKILEALRGHHFDDATVNNRYATLAASGITIRDALRYLVVRIQEKQAAASVAVEPEDGSAGYLPTDRVFEHGFDPLQGGFTAQSEEPFEVFDQWVEVLPTDQIVPVEVAYDPKTGMQL